MTRTYYVIEMGFQTYPVGELIVSERPVYGELLEGTGKVIDSRHRQWKLTVRAANRREAVAKATDRIETERETAFEAYNAKAAG